MREREIERQLRVQPRDALDHATHGVHRLAGPDQPGCARSLLHFDHVLCSFGVVLATLTLQIVASGFTAVRLSSYQYAMAQGVILILVMVADQVTWRRRRVARRPAGAAAVQA